MNAGVLSYNQMSVGTELLHAFANRQCVLDVRMKQRCLMVATNLENLFGLHQS